MEREKEQFREGQECDAINYSKEHAKEVDQLVPDNSEIGGITSTDIKEQDDISEQETATASDTGEDIDEIIAEYEDIKKTVNIFLEFMPESIRSFEGPLSEKVKLLLGHLNKNYEETEVSLTAEIRPARKRQYQYQPSYPMPLEKRANTESAKDVCDDSDDDDCIIMSDSPEVIQIESDDEN